MNAPSLCSEETICSDARTGSVVDDRIRPALEAGSRIGNSKPVLVIIDEIDGATGAGENVVLLSGINDEILILLTDGKLRSKADRAHPRQGKEER